jgi:YHS domain-containing protein
MTPTFTVEYSYISGLRVHPVVPMAVDPVCKMDVDEKTAKFKSTYREKTYYFCSPGCKKAFDADPKKYL